MITPLQQAIKAPAPSVQVVNEPVPGIDQLLKVLAETIEHSIYPIVKSMNKKLDVNLRTHHKLKDIAEQLRRLEAETTGKSGIGTSD